MKALLDFLPVLLFFIVYKFQDIYAATAVAIVASVLMILGQYIMQRKVEPMTLLSGALVVVFGGATIWLHNEVFIKLKPSLLYFLFAAGFLIAELRGTLVVEKFIGRQLDREVAPAVWRQLNHYWILFFVLAALLNLYVAYTFPTDTWVNFKLFGLMAITLVFMVFQSFFIMRALDASEKLKNSTDPDSPERKP